MEKELKMKQLMEDATLLINNKELISKNRRIFEIDLNPMTTQKAVQLIENLTKQK